MAAGLSEPAAGGGGTFLTGVAGLASEPLPQRPPRPAAYPGALQTVSGKKASLAALPAPPAAASLSDRDARPTLKDKASRQKLTDAFVREHCSTHVKEEWEPVDDRKVAKLRGILAALQEENQDTQVLRRESENAEAKRLLDATRESVEKRMQACRVREAVFTQKQAELLKQVKESEKSLQELETNIEKSEKNSKDEGSECKKLDREIAELEGQLRKQEQVREAEQKKIAQTSKYKKFLEKAVKYSTEEYEGDIENLLKRHSTLEAGHRELHHNNTDLMRRLDTKRDEALRVQTRLQNEHLTISSQLHDCEVSLDEHRTRSAEMEQRLNRALEEKELKESQVGVIHMAIEQIFTRTVNSCRLKQRRKTMLDCVDIKFAPLRGDKSDMRLEEMLKQITERLQDLRAMNAEAAEELARTRPQQDLNDRLDADVEPKIVVINAGGYRPGGVESSAATSDLLGSGSSHSHATAHGSHGWRQEAQDS